MPWATREGQAGNPTRRLNTGRKQAAGRTIPRHPRAGRGEEPGEPGCGLVSIWLVSVRTCVLSSAMAPRPQGTHPLLLCVLPRRPGQHGGRVGLRSWVYSYSMLLYHAFAMRRACSPFPCRPHLQGWSSQWVTTLPLLHLLSPCRSAPNGSLTEPIGLAGRGLAPGPGKQTGKILGVWAV